ncbi:putative dihydroxyacetone phosphate acyltransferase [Apostichopus japonicus]|uniref:Putative dihydroxyacetone phosphate acyltransferase n=1 Tax=Stichopus japonicus TaxID=307972 RepID=A0A2G8LQC4_STIJA|nr:putative dihydroxyacetone phosphate acyltransferase [Apostichopus japonicus]
MDDFEDILEPRRNELDVRFALQSRDGVPEYKYTNKQTRSQVNESVLSSPRLKFTIDKIVTETGLSRKEVEKEAFEILDDMAHAQSLTNLRTLAYIFPKLYKRLLRHLYVNKDGIEKLRAQVKDAPVILLPTHRSYQDFLVMTYVCFHYGLPLPFVATGQDFNKMKLINEVLRMCGAFYIRRSFGTDDLYWALFTEYVQTNVINGELPLEFFLEGTRSRTGKFLPPKLGLLAVALEPYFTGKVPDILVVPVSFTYDRILEELLHSREMLGIPKPKESTSGLFKARTILQDNYGDIYVHVGDLYLFVRWPLRGSTDQCIILFQAQYDLRSNGTDITSAPIGIQKILPFILLRVQPMCYHWFLFNLSSSEQKFVADLAYNVQESQLRNIYMSVWVLCATLLMQRPHGYTLRDFCRDVEWLKDLAINLGAKVAWPGEYSVQTLVTSHLKRHRTFVNLAHKNQVSINAYEGSPLPTGSMEMNSLDEVMSLAVVPMGIAMYRNHLVCRLANVCLLTSSFCGTNAISIGDLFLKFWFLIRVFQKEFVFKPSVTETEFAATLKKLESCTFIQVCNTEKKVEVLSNGMKALSFLSKMVEPFLQGYYMVCQYLVQTKWNPDNDNKSKSIAKNIQALIAQKFINDEMKHFDTLSLNLIGNALTSLVAMDYIQCNKSENGGSLSWQASKVEEVMAKLGSYLPELEINGGAVQTHRTRREPMSVPSKL